MPINFEQELNAEQLAVVQSGDGPCLVLAGAGSGKTRTIVYRVAWLLEHGVDPHSIMLVTFTNKAAKEMLSRVDTLTNGASKGIFGGTFHHLGNLFLRRYAARIGLNSHFTILDADDSQSMMKQIMNANGTSRSKLFPKPAVLRDVWSFIRNSGMNPEEYVADRFGHLSDEEIAALLMIFQGYEQKKQSTNQMDFDDLLIHWRTLLQESALSASFRDFRYILVDEYQDTNVVQGDIVAALAKPHKNILVVGDDSQSIYSFRAATVRNILEFQKQFENAKIYKLETNYRSTPEILHLANTSIANNRNRHDKNLKSAKEQGTKPELRVFDDTDREARWIADDIVRSHSAGASWHSHAALFRAAYQAIDTELAFAKRGIPYVMRGGIRFFEQAHVKDVLSYCRVLANPLDELAWKRILLMEDGIGDAKADRVWQSIRQCAPSEQSTPIDLQWIASCGLPTHTANVLSKLAGLGGDLLADGVGTIIENGYSEYLESNFDNHKDRLADIEHLGSFAARYATLQEFLADASLSEGFRSDRTVGRSAQDDVVVLSTIHQAKGLEWNQVYVIGLAEGQFPHIKVMDRPHELEEERRLFYVAVTRAADRLTLTYPEQSKSAYAGVSYNDVSRFIDELPDDAYVRRMGAARVLRSESGIVVTGGGILDRILRANRGAR